jgi:hypothetical protein
VKEDIVNRQYPAPPDGAREVLEELLWEAEIEQLGKMTPEQIAEEAKGSGLSDEDARQMLARAIARVDAEGSEPAALPEWALEDDLEDLLDEAWVRCIADMSCAEIKQLSTGTSLTDEQAEAILRCAKARRAAL